MSRQRGGRGGCLQGACDRRRGGLVGTPWARKTEVYAHEILKAVFYRLVTLRSGWEIQIPLRRIAFAHGRP